MSLLATLRCWWRAIARRSRTDREVSEELQFHLDAYAGDLIRQGMTPAEAQRRARIDFGRTDTQSEKYRDAIGLRSFDEIGADIRYGLRSLFKNLGFSTIAILSLVVGTGYFATLGIPLLQGRLWDESENTRGAAVVVINQTLARQYFPMGNSIGKQVRLTTLEIPSNDSGEVVGVPNINGWLQIIGVAADSINDSPDRPVQPALYMPYTRFMWMGTQFLVRTQGAPLAVLHNVRLAIQSINPDQPTARNVYDLQYLLEQEPARQQQRMFSILFGVFSGLALALALIGLYSVISYSVTQRMNEFGIRMALGAQRWHVLWLVVHSVSITVGGGLVTGLIITLAFRKFMVQWTSSSSHNPLILAAVIVLFLLSAAGACIFPVLRATSIDPTEALRYE